MNQSPKVGSGFRFGVFELDLEAGELRKHGLKVALQDQPFRLLALLLERPGVVVTREELKQHLWPADTFVEFDRSLNTAMAKLREALSDSADRPRFVETIPRRGYRFLAPVVVLSAANLREPHRPTVSGVRFYENSAFWIWTLSAALLATACLAGWQWLQARRPVVRNLPLRKFTLVPQEAEPVRALAISPSGEQIAYLTGSRADSGSHRLWVWRLSVSEPHELAALAGSWTPFGAPLFWGPGEKSVVIASAGQLKKVPVDGGPVTTLCGIPGGLFFGGFPAVDGDAIVFAAGPPSRLYEISVQGGSPRLLAEHRQSTADFSAPQALPTAARPRPLLVSAGALEQVVLYDSTSGRRQILAAGLRPVYSPSGHVVFEKSSMRSEVWAIPFSLPELRPTGDPFPVAEDARFPSVALDGTLVYLHPGHPGGKQLAWRDRQGKKLGFIGQSQKEIWCPSLSPDGRFIGVEGHEEATGEDLWIHSVAQRTKTRLTLDSTRDSRAIWSPDGKEIAFWSLENGIPVVFRIPADGSSGRKPVMVDGRPLQGFPDAWSPDGKYLIYAPPWTWTLCRVERNPQGDWGNSTCWPTSSWEVAASISPDGRFLAYVSGESGMSEVYVRPLLDGGEKWRISTNGGSQPRWSRDGKELFYVEGNTLLAVSVSTKPPFSFGAATRLFSDPNLDWKYGHPIYDVSADGRRFVLTEPVGESRQASIHVVQNWFAEFKR
jgi:DNA-binding winged helix-turn-helix (wHTH) protein